MTSTDQLLVGILSGIVVWTVAALIRMLGTKYRLECAILTDIKSKLNSVKDNKDYLIPFFDVELKKEKIGRAAYYKVDDFMLYKSSQCDMIRLLSKKKLLKVVKFYDALWELEVLMEGLMKDALKLKEEEKVLKDDDIDWLKRKRARIDKLSELVLENDIRGLKDLPDDYRKRIAPDTLILK